MGRENLVLTPKQQRFCEAYILTGNASEAYRRSYEASRMAAKTITEKASRLLTQDNIAAMVEELQGRLRAKFELSAERVIREYMKIAFADIRKCFDEAGNLLPVSKMSEEAAAALASVDVVSHQGGEFLQISKIKLNSKVAALDSLARHLGLFKADNDQKDRLVIIKDFTGGEY